jgi:uncharacterized protein (DUF924 family)
MNAATMRRAKPLLEFWFGDAANDPVRAAGRMPLWFGVDSEWDASIRDRWAPLMSLASDRELESWGARPRTALALVLLLDQFPRNLYRGDPRAFAQDKAALTLTREGVDVGFLERLSPIEQVFFAMPFQHVEDRRLQDEGLAVFEGIRDRGGEVWRDLLTNVVDFAKKHRDLVARFGRFPHRNQILGRESTPEEARYLEQGGETFGQSA